MNDQRSQFYSRGKVHAPSFGSARCCKVLRDGDLSGSSTFQALHRVRDGMAPYPACQFHGAITLGTDAAKAADLVVRCACAAGPLHPMHVTMDVHVARRSAALCRGFAALVGARTVQTNSVENGRWMVRVDPTPWARASRTPSMQRTSFGTEPAHIVISI